MNKKELFKNLPRNNQELSQKNMEKDNVKKQKTSPKTSKIKCMSTGKLEIKQRSDAKYANPLYGKRESEYRKKKGYLFDISKFLKNGLKKFYYDDFWQSHKNPFKEQIKALIKTKRPEEMKQPWKHDFDDFIFYYFPQLTSRPYEIYCNENGKKKWDRYVLTNDPLIEQKKELKFYPPINLDSTEPNYVNYTRYKIKNNTSD